MLEHLSSEGLGALLSSRVSALHVGSPGLHLHHHIPLCGGTSVMPVLSSGGQESKVILSFIIWNK